ncbi:cysteine proteinase inhibitor 5 [Phalaenopsis equestris]|uniref:cysteine proteinase inhibitor 5 n=1 Tax=Phalaenopsis equestris TaxID=78828 RepID=UPI0009E53F2C|nr:cysteine proteinase inhibitor 5 [Phalaenopsis equestris]
MASSSLLLILPLLLLLSASPSPAAATHRFNSGLDRGRKVGSWTEIPDAESNREIRDLGRYSVNEYNHVFRGSAENPIVFSGVVSAARQVVSGIKYRIRVAAVDARTGDRRFFDAVVVVRAWLRNGDRELVYFSPSTD